jgi:CubicO group peptidase (beta-lactamase class C family)
MRGTWIAAALALLGACSTSNALPLSEGDDGAGDASRPGDAGIADAGATQPLDASGALDDYVATEMRIGQMPGLAVVLVRGTTVLLARGYGYADVEGGVPATADTLFQLASVSKTVTATALMQLEEQGAFALDDDVNGKLGWSARSPYFPDASVTYRMVLDHSASIHDGPQVDDYVVADADSPIPLDTFMQGYLTPDGGYYGPKHWNATQPPGAVYEYSNAGAALAGDLAERISGQNLQDYCQAHVFGPLGMTETSWFLAGLDRSHIAVPYTFDPDAGIAPGPYLGWPTYPDGQLRTSANQLARFLMAYIGQGSYAGAQILKAATVAEMIREQFPGSGEGLFWEAWDLDSYHLVGHDGLYTGMSSSMWYDPTSGAGFVMLVNSDVGGATGAPGQAYDDLTVKFMTTAETAP